MSNQDTIRLKVPRQDLDQSSFFECEEKAVAQWLGELPMANLGQSTRKLYQALTELNRVRMLPVKRMAILEKMRTSIYYVSRSLTKHYLNQSIVMPEQPRKVADLAHTLHQHLATGYTIVATHTAALGKQSGVNKPSSLIAPALHRAITDHTLNMQRHYQLYEPVDPGVWHNLHQFHSLAKQHDILHNKIDDTEFGSCTVQGSYIRALLIGCSKPNQLRQEDFMGAFAPLTSWADKCKILPIDTEALFIIDPAGDQPPGYRELYKSALKDNWLSLDTVRLAKHLETLREDSDDKVLKVEDNGQQISRDLLGHLILSWGSMSKRTFMRLEADDTLDLCIGLSATHHFVSGELSFEALVEKRGAKTYTMANENPFLKTPTHHHRQKDVWDSPYESNVGQSNVSLESIDYHIRDNEQGGSNGNGNGNGDSNSSSKYRNHSVQMVNSSAHGYCVEWPIDATAQIKTGEIVGIKESHSHNWSIAVIRWVTHSGEKKTQLGLELISPSASPYGARIIRKKGGSNEYMRVLILPEIPVTKQPVTLLTPRVPFRSGQKIVLNQRAKEVQIQLNTKLNDTGAYNQFVFRKVSSTNTSDHDQDDNDDLSNSSEDNDFDSLWGNL